MKRKRKTVRHYGWYVRRTKGNTKIMNMFKIICPCGNAFDHTRTLSATCWLLKYSLPNGRALPCCLLVCPHVPVRNKILIREKSSQQKKNTLNNTQMTGPCVWLLSGEINCYHRSFVAVPFCRVESADAVGDSN